MRPPLHLNTPNTPLAMRLTKLHLQIARLGRKLRRLLRLVRVGKSAFDVPPGDITACISIFACEIHRLRFPCSCRVGVWDLGHWQPEGRLWHGWPVTLGRQCEWAPLFEGALVGEGERGRDHGAEGDNEHAA